MLWNKVEAFERRKDAQLAMKFTLALPMELTLAENIELARDFIKVYCERKHCLADWSIHLKHDNLHIDGIRTIRYLEPEGFGKRIDIWKMRKQDLLESRELSAQFQNMALKRYGHNVQVDHRSHADRGLEIAPGIKMGPTPHMEARGSKTRKQAEQAEIEASNREKILNNPDVILMF